MGKFFEALKKSDEGKNRSKPSLVEDVDWDNTSDQAATDAIIESSEPATPAAGYMGVEASTAKAVETAEVGAREKIKRQRSHHISLGLDKNLIAHHNPHSFEGEQFRMLRTNILFPPGNKRPPRTILVTSALPGEGKSFVAANLSVTIAQNIDKHVLLMDCDLRRPTVHHLFGYQDVPGLSNYLQGEGVLPEYLIKTDLERLAILPGGPVPPNPAELLSSNRMLSLLREVRDRYQDRIVVIDSPPPHLTAESKALAQFVDGIILVVRIGQTDRDLVSQLAEKFQKDRIVGVVANWIERESRVFYGSGKYKEYNYYGSRKQR